MDEARISEILERLARLESEVKAAFKRIDEQKALAESVHSIALSVERLAYAQKSVEDKLSSIAEDVDELKEKPAKRWDKAVWLAVSAAIGAAVGYILKAIGLG